jgi:acyl-ACP thioesterase
MRVPVASTPFPRNSLRSFRRTDAIPWWERHRGLAFPPMDATDPASGSGPVRRSGRANGASVILPLPSVGRVFRSQRRVRLGDVDPSGRLRLDAFARYLQDIATDDSDDLGQLGDRTWVVRRTLVEQRQAPRLDDSVGLATFCSGTGSRWAERRVSLDGPGGASVETVTLWVHLDPVSGRPKPLPADFRAVHEVASDGREVTARQEHEPVPVDDPHTHTIPWWPRVTDLDVLDHVNNAVAWEVVEQTVDRMVGRGRLDLDPAGRVRAEVEFRDAIDHDAVRDARPLTIACRAGGGVLELTLWSSDGSTAHITARVSAGR